MKEKPTELKALFEAFKNGDPESLDAVIGAEKHLLFDYLMRMTGQQSRSMDILQESINGVVPVADQEDSLQDFLVLFYKTARSFSMEGWNAETSMLENLSYGEPDSGLTERQSSHLIEIEKVVRSLPAKQREILLLNFRYGFSLEEVSFITGYDSADVEEISEQGKSVMAAALSAPFAKISADLLRLLCFPMPNEVEEGTQNLSIVVRDLKKASKSSTSRFSRILWWIFLAALLGYLMWDYQRVTELLTSISYL